MHFITRLRAAPELLLEATLATTPPTPTHRPLSHLARWISPRSFGEGKGTFHLRGLLTSATAPTTTTTGAPFSPKVLAISHRRPFATATSSDHKSRLFLGQKARAEMLSQYVSRLVSTIKTQFASAAMEQSEQDHIASLMGDSRANKRVQITACGQLYEELTRTKPLLFCRAPHEGIQFNVEYYDSWDLLSSSSSNEPSSADDETAKKEDNANRPTVCLLHGAPGHYRDFSGMIYHLTKDGIRVVAPNFPDYSATFQHSFRHSPRERLDFLLQFFKAINLTRVDMLLGHSSAVYTMFELLNHSKQPAEAQSNPATCGPLLEIKSMALMSTPSHVLPHNLAPTPLRLFTLKLFDYSILRPFILTLIQAFVKFQGIRNRVDTNRIEDLLIAASAMGFSQHAKMADRLKLLHKYRIPAILIYGTSDRLITLNNFKQLERDLGITSDDQVRRYTSDGSVEFPARDRNELIDVSRFEKGGHYTFQKYSSQVSEDLYRFLTERVLEPTEGIQSDLEGEDSSDALQKGEEEATKL